RSDISAQSLIDGSRIFAPSHRCVLVRKHRLVPVLHLVRVDFLEQRRAFRGRRKRFRDTPAFARSQAAFSVAKFLIVSLRRHRSRTESQLRSSSEMRIRPTRSACFSPIISLNVCSNVSEL